MKKLIYVRHGQSQANLNNVYGEFGSPLTELGRSQAADAASQMRAMPPVDIVFASPQPRALETAQIITKNINYAGEIVIHDDIVERKYGTFIGTPFAQDSDALDVSADPTAETIEQLFDRAQKFYEYVRSVPEDTVLVVAHGAFGRALMRVVRGQEPHFPIDSIPNAIPFVLV